MALAKLKAKLPFVKKQSATYDVKETDVKDPEKDDSSSLSSGDENEERGNWGHQAEFILACLGYAVGLGNIWRFPYLCMRNGGGAFLIPYFLCMFLCAMPLFFLELTIGQFSSLSPIQVWNFSPIFRGLGWGMVILSGICCLYYNIILTWVLYYLGMSLKSIGKSQLPWGSCDNEWNTPMCSSRSRSSNLSLFTNISNLNESYGVPTEASYAVATAASVLANGTEIQTKSPSEEFWQYHVLELSSGIFDFGGVRWQLLVCLIVAWIIVFLCMCRGVKSTGKVVYVTATLPYVFLFILLIRGATLPGAIDGVKYYIYPDFKKLLNFKVWAEACIQIFYSLGPAWGGLITMSSFSKFHNNHLRDAILIPTVTCLTSFFAGFVIFSVIGYMAYEANLPVEKVVTSGPGLAFIAYPEALNKMPLAPFWAISFFTMLLTVGLDSQFAMFECLVSGFVDQFPNVLLKRKMSFTLVLCVAMCLGGVLLCSRAGMYWFQILDWYCAAFSCMIIGFLECIACAYVYGANRMYDDITMMIGYRPNLWWKITWMGITPVSLIVIICYSFGNLTEPTYGEYTYPKAAIAIGWAIALSSTLPLFLFAIYEIVMAKGTFLQRLRKVSRPSEAWGPALEKHRSIYKHRFVAESVKSISINDSAHFNGEEKVDLYPESEKQAV